MHRDYSSALNEGIKDIMRLVQYFFGLMRIGDYAVNYAFDGRRINNFWNGVKSVFFLKT
ncbi:MAG: hypothetical protein AB8V23_03710 [Candidatus Midichloria sp.]